MNEIQQVLYMDPQAETCGQYCPVCGGECYFPSLVCLRCERRTP